MLEWGLAERGRITLIPQRPTLNWMLACDAGLGRSGRSQLPLTLGKTEGDAAVVIFIEDQPMISPHLRKDSGRAKTN